MNPTDNNSLAHIAAKLDRISRVLAGLLLKDLQETDQSKKIACLKGCGFSNPEIAALLGTTPNTVGVAVHKLKRSRGKRSRKAKLKK